MPVPVEDPVVVVAFANALESVAAASPVVVEREKKFELMQDD